MAGEEGLLGGEGALARLRAAIVVQARRIDPFQGLAAALPVGGLPALEQAEDFAFGGSLDQRWVQAEERGAEYRAQSRRIENILVVRLRRTPIVPYPPTLANGPGRFFRFRNAVGITDTLRTAFPHL